MALLIDISREKFVDVPFLQDAIEQTGLEPRAGAVVSNIAAEVCHTDSFTLVEIFNNENILIVEYLSQINAFQVGAAPSVQNAVEVYTRQALQVVISFNSGY